MVRSEGPHRKRSLARTQIGAFLAACLLAGSVAAATLSRVTNLARLGAQAQARHAPIVLLFWSPTCHYCHVVEHVFLLPAAHGRRYRQVLFRRVDIDSARPLTDFAGAPTTEAMFAARYHITLVPDVRFFNGQGRQVAPHILGISDPDFYAAYLDQALDHAIAACRR